MPDEPNCTLGYGDRVPGAVRNGGARGAFDAPAARALRLPLLPWAVRSRYVRASEPGCAAGRHGRSSRTKRATGRRPNTFVSGMEPA